MKELINRIQVAEILSVDNNEAGLLPYIDILEKKMRK